MKVTQARLATLMDRVRLEVDGGFLPSAQVAVAHEGALVAFETVGDATPQTRYVLQSCGRVLVAGVVWKLISDGLVDVTRKVVDYIPEFGENGKEAVTVEQVMTHTAGFPLAPLGYPRMVERSDRVEAFRKWRLTYEPGTRLEFHLTSAAWVLEEICFRVSGRPMKQFLKDEITGPLGLDSIEIGPSVSASDIAPFVMTGDDPGAEVNPWGAWYLAPRDVLAAGEPSHSTVATAADLALFGQALMSSEVWSRTVIEDATRIRVTLPVEGERGFTHQVAGNTALFVVVAGEDGLQHAFLPTTGTPALFGHGGASSQITFADPGTGLSFAFLTNGYPPSGYDGSRAGLNRIINIGNLAADLVE